MANGKKGPPFEYRMAEHGGMWHVFIVHDETPEWWRLIASFPTEARAQSYRDIESDCWDEDESVWPQKDDPEAYLPATEGSALLPDPPASKVRAELFRPATPAERARVGAELLTDAAAEARQTLRIEAAPEPVVAAPAELVAPEPQPVAAEDESPAEPATEVEEEIGDLAEEELAPEPVQTAPDYANPMQTRKPIRRS